MSEELEAQALPTIPADLLALLDRDEGEVTRWGLSPHPQNVWQTWWYVFYGSKDTTMVIERLRNSGWPDAFTPGERTIYLRRALTLECRDDDMHAILRLRVLQGAISATVSALRRSADSLDAILHSRLRGTEASEE
jgi:hypothetical protein